MLPTKSKLTSFLRKAILPALLLAGAAQADAQALTRDSFVYVRGLVLNDRNGMTDTLINGAPIFKITTTPESTTPTQTIYVYLVDSVRKVVDVAPVPENAPFLLEGRRYGNYNVALSTIPLPIGSDEPTYTLNNYWKETGEGLLPSLAGDGFPDLSIAIFANDTTVNVRFGIDARPQGTNYTLKTDVRDVSDRRLLMIPAEAFKGRDFEDGIYANGMLNRPIDLFGPSHGELYYKGQKIQNISTSISARIDSFDVTQLRFRFQDGLPRQFGFSLVDDALVTQLRPSTIYLEVALPVTLTNFSGRRENEQNILDWTTATEKVNSGFYVERSVDGENFEEAGFVPSKALYGFSNTPTNYTFLDNAAGVNAASYYRLRQTDMDGTAQYSKTVKLGTGSGSGFAGQLSIYPSPSNGPVTLDWNAGPGVYQMQVQNAAGAVVLSQQLQSSGNALHSTVNLSTLPSGNYFVTLKAGDQQQSQPIVITAR